jgi:hypothetical protein
MSQGKQQVEGITPFIAPFVEKGDDIPKSPERKNDD